MSASPKNGHIAERLLQRAHSPDTAARIFKDRVVTKPLLLRVSSPPPSALEARARRQQERQKRRKLRRHSNKPRPLSAKQKRALGVYEIPEAEKRWEIYAGLNRIWQGYMRDILRLEKGKGGFVTPASAGPILATADFHGAEVEVVRSRCVSRVGLKGIVVKDTKYTFEIITGKNDVKSMLLLSLDVLTADRVQLFRKSIRCFASKFLLGSRTRRERGKHRTTWYLSCMESSSRTEPQTEQRKSSSRRFWTTCDSTWHKMKLASAGNG